MNLALGSIAALLLLTTSVAHAADSIPQVTAQARAEGKKWHDDAQLVQISVTDFGFAVNGSGIPDVTQSGPPKVAMYYFLSPSAGEALRITVDINREQTLPPEALRIMQAQGSRMRWEKLPTPYSPYTLPLPEKIGDPDPAISTARKDLSLECAGASPGMSSCTLVQEAELHMFWNGKPDDSGRPVWTIRFGQNPRTLQTVSREVGATSGELVALDDIQRASISPEPNQHIQNIALAGIPNDFDSIWRAVNEAMQKQDPLYKPYAAALTLYLRDNRGPDTQLSLSDAEIQFARITPSFYWEDRIVHVKWQAGSAILDVSPAIPRHAPEEPIPRTMEWQKLPREDGALHRIVDAFPLNYAEKYTTWQTGCQDLMTVSPNIKAWECGVVVPTTHRTDKIFLWLSRQGNPYWEAAGAPLPTEHSLVSSAVPRDRWIWWTRLLRNDQAQYVILDAATGGPAVPEQLCSAPSGGFDLKPLAIEPCR